MCVCFIKVDWDADIVTSAFRTDGSYGRLHSADIQMTWSASSEPISAMVAFEVVTEARAELQSRVILNVER
jgi:hypothetical protein